MCLLESAQETTGMKSFQLAHFSKPCFGMIASLCLVDWPRICSKSSVQNVAFDTLVKRCIYASQRAILASLSHGCRAVAKRYKCPLLGRGQQGFVLQDNIQNEKLRAYRYQISKASLFNTVAVHPAARRQKTQSTPTLLPHTSEAMRRCSDRCLCWPPPPHVSSFSAGRAEALAPFSILGLGFGPLALAASAGLLT